MRIKKPKSLKELEVNHFFDNIKDIEFNNSKNYILDIGAGKGEFITNLAYLNPHDVFIAIEKQSVIAYRIYQKKIKLGLNNLYIIRGDIDELVQNIPLCVISTIYLNFSDPWPKLRHHKNRLTFPTKLAKYDEILKKDGELIFKTDQLDFFNDTLEYLKTSNSFLINIIDYDLKESDVMSEYEKNKRLTSKINYVKAKKNDQNVKGIT